MSSSLTEPAAPKSVCEQCGVALPHGAAEGLCPLCVLTAALYSLEESEGPAPELESPATLLERRDFGDYELLESIGRGGMGVVFKARQKRPGRLVALKVIAGGELASPKMVDRFHLEARAVASLLHPNIVPIFEVGEHGGWHYFSMQLVEGPTLAEVIAHLHGKGEATASRHATEAETIAQLLADPRERAVLMARLARAVHQAHQRGILHRDLKPTNILLDARGEPHLTDFGLAKVLAEDSSLTLSRAVLGTPAYMAPEQAAGQMERITVATDVYGLGAVFYELLAGRPPLVAQTTAELWRMIAEEEPPRLNRAQLAGSRGARRTTSTPHDLEVICLKCLEKNPAQRYRSALEFTEDLERWLRKEPILARPAGALERTWKWARRHPARAGLIATVALSGVLLTAGSLYFNVRLSQARAAAEQRAIETRGQLMRQHLREASRRIEADDAFAGALSAAEALRQMGPAAAERRAAIDRLNLIFEISPRLLRLWEAAGVPEEFRFAADGTALTTRVRGRSPQIWNVATGDPIDSPAPRNSPKPDEELNHPVQTVSPDGSCEAVTGRDYTVRVVRRRDQHAVTPSLRHGAKVTALAFSPDGRFLATGSADRTVRVWDLSGPRRRLYPGGFPVSRPHASPDGKWFAARDADGTCRLFDGNTGEPAGRSFNPGGPLASVAFDSANRFFATCTSSNLIRVWNRDTQEMAAEFGHFTWTASWLSLEFSPDGSRLAAADSQGRLWCWQVAEKKLAFASDSFDVATRRVEWSSRGRWLLTASEDGVRIWSGTDGRLMTTHPLRGSGQAFTARFSPDSKRLIASFEGEAGEPSAALIWEIPSFRRMGPPLVHADGVRDVRFSPDGLRAVTSGKDNVIRQWNAASGLPATPAMHHPDTIKNSSYSRDGRWLLSVDDGGMVRIWESATGELLGPPLPLAFPLLDVGTAGSERAILVRAAKGPGWWFSLPAEIRTDKDLATWAMLCSGQRLDVAGGLSPVSAAELAERFSVYWRQHPDRLILPDNAESWHEEQALIAELTEDWGAAQFHLRRLLELRLNDPELIKRLAGASAHLR